MTFERPMPGCLNSSTLIFFDRKISGSTNLKACYLPYSSNTLTYHPGARSLSACPEIEWSKRKNRTKIGIFTQGSYMICAEISEAHELGWGWGESQTSLF